MAGRVGVAAGRFQACCNRAREQPSICRRIPRNWLFECGCTGAGIVGLLRLPLAQVTNRVMNVNSPSAVRDECVARICAALAMVRTPFPSLVARTKSSVLLPASSTSIDFRPDFGSLGDDATSESSAALSAEDGDAAPNADQVAVPPQSPCQAALPPTPRGQRRPVAPARALMMRPSLPAGAWQPLRGVAPYGDDGVSWWRAGFHGLVALLATVKERLLY